MSTLVKNIIFFLVVVGVVLGGYWFVTRTPEVVEDESGVTAVVATTGDNPADEFSALLEKLSGVDFQGSNPIFREPVFRNGLASYRRDLPEIDRVRSNPFAPIEGNPASYTHYRAPVSAIKPAATATLSAFPTASTTKATTTKK